MKKLIIFDLDDTLVADKASADAAFRITSEIGAKRSAVDPACLQANIWKVCRSIWKNSPARAYCLEIGISSWEGLWAEFLGEDENLRILSQWAATYRQKAWRKALQMCDGGNDETLAKVLSEVFISERRKLHTVYEEVPSVLEYFKGFYILVLLTNGLSDLQRRKVNGSGLEKFFDSIVISGEVGMGKPDFRIYNLILENLGIRPESAVMVGDSLSSDIAPALDLGITAVWINRYGKPGNPSIVPDIEIDNLRQMKENYKPFH